MNNTTINMSNNKITDPIVQSIIAQANEAKSMEKYVVIANSFKEHLQKRFKWYTNFLINNKYVAHANHNRWDVNLFNIEECLDKHVTPVVMKYCNQTVRCDNEDLSKDAFIKELTDQINEFVESNVIMTDYDSDNDDSDACGSDFDEDEDEDEVKADENDADDEPSRSISIYDSIDGRQLFGYKSLIWCFSTYLVDHVLIKNKDFGLLSYNKFNKGKTFKLYVECRTYAITEYIKFVRETIVQFIKDGTKKYLHQLGNNVIDYCIHDRKHSDIVDMVCVAVNLKIDEEFKDTIELNNLFDETVSHIDNTSGKTKNECYECDKNKFRSFNFDDDIIRETRPSDDEEDD